MNKICPHCKGDYSFVSFTFCPYCGLKLSIHAPGETICGTSTDAETQAWGEKNIKLGLAEKLTPETEMALSLCSNKNSDGQFPKEWQKALDALYSGHTDNPTPAQKLNILIITLGDCNVTCLADSPEQYERLKVRLMELDYLESIGLYTPTFV